MATPALARDEHSTERGYLADPSTVFEVAISDLVATDHDGFLW